MLPLIFAVARVQATQNALVTGQVLRKRDLLPFPGVKVTLLNPSIGFSQSGETNSFGNYGFLSVPPQPGYILTAQIGDGAPSTREFDVAIADQKLVLPPIELEDAGTGLQLLAKSPTTGTSGPAPPTSPKGPAALLLALLSSPLSVVLLGPARLQHRHRRKSRPHKATTGRAAFTLRHSAGCRRG